MAFNLTVALQIQGPVGLDRVLNNIRSKVAGFQAPVNIGINPATVGTLNQVNTGLNRLQTNLRATAQAASATAAGITAMRATTADSGSAIERLGSQAGLAARRFIAFSVAAGTLVRSIQAIKSGLSEALNFQNQLIRIGQ